MVTPLSFRSDYIFQKTEIGDLFDIYWRMAVDKVHEADHSDKESIISEAKDAVEEKNRPLRIEDLDEYIVYRDPKSELYYYPYAAGRNGKPIRVVDMLPPDDLENYIVGTPEEFLDLKREAEELRNKKSVPEELVIYYDPEEMKYFYPTSMLNDEICTSTPIVKAQKPPITYNKINNAYYDVMGYEFTKFNSPKEFRDLKRKVIKTTDVRYDEAQCTPIYYDQETGKFYYPRAAAEDREIVARKLLIGRPALYYDPNYKMHYNVTTGEPYMMTFSPSEFKQKRQEILAKVIEESDKLMAKRNPIYYDDETGRYYYPMGALEDSDQQLRDVVPWASQLDYNTVLNTWYDVESGESYVMADNSGQFEILKAGFRKKTTGDKVKAMVGTTPVYFDGIKYYYPKEALEIEEEIEPKIEGKPVGCLMFDYRTKIHYDAFTGNEFIMLDSVKDLMKIKAQKEHRSRFFKEYVGYYDPVIEKYFFPKWAARTGLDPYEIKEGPPPLKFDAKTGSHYHPTTGEEFLMTDSLDLFKTLQLQYCYENLRIDLQFERQTPVWYDPVRGLYFYPKTAIEREDMEHLNIIFRRPFLYCNANNNTLYDPSTGADYVTVHKQEQLYQNTVDQVG